MLFQSPVKRFADVVPFGQDPQKPCAVHLRYFPWGSILVNTMAVATGACSLAVEAVCPDASPPDRLSKDVLLLLVCVQSMSIAYTVKWGHERQEVLSPVSKLDVVIG